MYNRIIYVPIEPLVERYTESWYRNFPVAFREAGHEVIVIDGVPLTDHVGVGTFLDMNSTIHYKNSQMQKIAKMFNDGQIWKNDIFFIGDVEFWGIESIRLMSQMNKIPVNIVGFLHAASYTKEDAFEVAAPYQKYTELGWLAALDRVFVGSQYHKQAVIERRIVPYADPADLHDLSNKIIVTGNPLFEEDYPSFPDVEKTNKIIISNRFDWEKRPNLSLQFAYLAKKRHPDWEIVVTTSRPTFKSNKKWLEELALRMQEDGIITIKSGLTKEQYHRELASSKIMLSNSIEENFGYCIAEAMMYNTYPLLPNSLSHPEVAGFQDMMLFDDEDEIIDKMEYLMQQEVYVRELAEYYVDNPIVRMVQEMRDIRFPTGNYTYYD